jgi:hypothetical protein
VTEGEGELVEQYIKTVMARIATTAYESWEKKPSLLKSQESPIRLETARAQYPSATFSFNLDA